MIRWLILLILSFAVSFLAEVMAPAWGGVWLQVPILGFWYLIIRIMAGPAKRVGAMLPSLVVAIGVAPHVPWQLLLTTLSIIITAEVSEVYFFTKRRLAPYGVTVLALSVGLIGRVDPLTFISCLGFGLFQTYFTLRLKYEYFWR
jgi:hypothetical protein